MANFETTAASVIGRLSDDLGLTPAQAAGIVGQLGFESEGLQAINERKPVVPGSRGGFGWAQWTGPRRKQFEAFSEAQGLDVTDPEANYQFLLHELTQTPEGKVLDSIREVDDPYQAGRIFTNQFLRPGIKAQDKRDSWVDRAVAAILPAAQAGTLDAKLAEDPIFQMLSAPAAQPATGAPVPDALAADPIWQLLNEPAPAAEATPAPQTQAAAPVPEPGMLTNFARGLEQGLGDLPAGIGQSALHEGQRTLQAIDELLGTSLAQRGAPNVAARDAEVAQREQAYQAATPGSFSAGAGRFVGSAAPFMAGGPVSSALMAPGLRGAALASNFLPPTAARLVGGSAGMGLQGAGLGAVSPVSAGDYDTQQVQNMIAGGALGAAAPIVGSGLQAMGRGLGNVMGMNVSPEVGGLAQVARARGIDVRPDQVLNSKPINAFSAALDYLPFSGKGASLGRQQKQFNTALSKTIGENTDNVVQAINSAEARLGKEFDQVLKNTAIKADDSFTDDLGRILTNARNELTDQQYGVVQRQVDNILNKVKSGDMIDADAGYNIKKALDRIGKSNDTSLAFYAREMRGSLMDALNRSLPDGGASFAKTRQQWANLMELQKLAPRGAEGNISAARLANARGIKTKDLSELSDIAAQFLKGRIGDSGTMPRIGFTHGMMGAGAYMEPVSALIGLAAGRAGNSVLGSKGLAGLIASRAASRGPTALNGAPSRFLPGAQVSPLQRLLYPSVVNHGVRGLSGLGVANENASRP